MLTFLELYQTMLGFVFFKLYTDAGLVYPPPLDIKKDEGAAGVGAYSLQEATKPALPSKPKAKEAFPESKASDQKSVDSAIIAAVKKTEYLSKYLRASWGLSKGQYPHQLTF